jgi:hypothetical protein
MLKFITLFIIPIIVLKRVFGALIKWNCTTKKLVAPGSFLKQHVRSAGGMARVFFQIHTHILSNGIT